MKLKRILVLIIGTALLLPSLAGCGDSKSGETTAAATTTAKATEKETEKEKADETEKETPDETKASETEGEDGLTLTEDPINLLFWDISTEDPGKMIAEEAVKRFTTAYPNVTVEHIHTQNDAYKEKLMIAMSSGQCPDMYMHWGGGPMNEYIDSGFAADITDLFNEYCDVPFLQPAVFQCTYNDKIYAVPYGGLSGSGIFYNKSIFDEAGVDVPKTIADLEEVCDKLLEAGYTPFSLANGSKWTGSMYFMYLATRFGGTDAFASVVDGSGSFTDEAFMYAAETIQDWVNKDYFPEGVNSLSTDDGQDRQLMYQEKCGMMLQGSWQARNMSADNVDWYKEKIGYFSFPILEDSKYDQTIVVGTSIGNGFSFNCDGEKLKAGFILATQFYNDDIYNQQQLDSNTIPSIEGMGNQIEDPCMKQVWADFSSAPAVQLWYDQYLPPEVSEKHKDLCQDIFGITKTPEQANQELQDAMDSYLKK